MRGHLEQALCPRTGQCVVSGMTPSCVLGAKNTVTIPRFLLRLILVGPSPQVAAALNWTMFLVGVLDRTKDKDLGQDLLKLDGVDLSMTHPQPTSSYI